MARIALLNKNGSSLIELMVALGILAIVAVALMQSSIVVLQASVKNEMRDEAVRIAEQRMNEIRSSKGGFDSADPGGSHVDLVVENYTYPPLLRNIRNAPVPFTVNKDVVGLDLETKQVTVTVSWTFRGQQFNHTVMSLMRRYQT